MLALTNNSKLYAKPNLDLIGCFLISLLENNLNPFVGSLIFILEIEGSQKINHYLPGTNIPILNENKLYLDQPDYVLLLSWHISDELINNLRKKGFKGKFIIPLPEPKLLD